ncbi:MAG: CpaF family protein [Deltaproteobacteria bacterium]|nr:CpaF family protein [Deltaproteobacteria bacterium]
MKSWLSFHSEEQTKLVSFSEHITVGSAEANIIHLMGKGVRALHGQFFTNEGHLLYRDFAQNSTQSLDEANDLKVGAWSVRSFSHDQLWSEWGEGLITSFKNILRESKSENLEESLNQLKALWFLRDPIPQEVEEKLISQFNELSMLGPIEYLLNQPDVTDVLVTRYDEIWVDEAGELKLSPYKFSNLETYKIYLENLLAKLHKTIDENIPYLDFVLPDGSRGHLISSPITDGISYLSIRKIRKDFFSLSNLFERKMFSEEIYSLLKKSLERRDNILISGSTGSGKTTLIKALIHECRQQERIVVAEDTPELRLPRANTVFLNTRTDSKTHLLPISLRELVRQSLRMRPDRIVIGEVRGEEALDLLHAMNTGHRGCMGSLHANSARDSLFRLQGLAQMCSANLSEAVTRDLIARNIHLIIHCGRDEKGKRQIEHLAYVRGLDQNQILLEAVSS